MNQIETSIHASWQVLCTYPNYEKKVHSMLVHNKIESYLPLIEVESIWSDRKKKLQKPLFPNYIFVRLKKRESPNLSLSAPGAIKFLRQDNKPCLIKDTEIQTIQKIISVTNDIGKERPSKIGDRVQVISGPFIGLIGIVGEIAGTNKLYIHLDILNQTISVKIHDANVKKIAWS